MAFRFKIDKKVAPALYALATLMVGGSLVYHFLEGWDYLDSLYFTTTTITTIGFGDLHPTTAPSKVFTILLALSGVSIGFYALSLLGKAYYENSERRLEQLRERVRLERKSILSEKKLVQAKMRELAEAQKRKQFQNKRYGF